MPKAPNHKPTGFHSVNPALVVKDAEKAISFYEKVFGAGELPETRLIDPASGSIAHAEVRLGDSILMLSEEFPNWGNLSPETVGGSPIILHVYVPDVDATVKRAAELGGEVLVPVDDQFYGDRSGRIRDPFGHVWGVATHVEEMSPEEMKRRWREFTKKMG